MRVSTLRVLFHRNSHSQLRVEQTNKKHVFGGGGHAVPIDSPIMPTVQI